MDRTERFYLMDQMFRRKGGTTMAQLMETLEVSRATVKRDLEYLRERMFAPVVWDAQCRVYRYELHGDDSRFELPGLWFNAEEAAALMSMDSLLRNLQPGLLSPHIEPFRDRIRVLLSTGDHSIKEASKRIRMLHIAARPVDTGCFEHIASGLLRRKRLLIAHYNRSTGRTVRREISPQRLVYYRDNWYLDAWCHLRKDLRSFSVDTIEAVETMTRRARNISGNRLDELLGSSYGIFSGRPVQRAVLRFTPERARWVSKEKWHSDQTAHTDEEGYYVLTVPYSDDRELIKDILGYGPDVMVLEPDTLKVRVQAHLRSAIQQYG